MKIVLLLASCFQTPHRPLLSTSAGKPLHYKGVRLHRIVKGFLAHGGDVVKVRSEPFRNANMLVCTQVSLPASELSLLLPI